ncbi:hypothetical protein [Corynebacterium ulcerans]|uniref:hypothetical protein n=1 Tax=Corynebacterium ulcerans TaxID=65058 RepID=UPI0005FEAC25|nr:hypothetical protein [Corynebacterium ulcerans]AKA95590.1 Hypothetical protein CUL131002_0029c [Corynebacterium ulcerans]
MYGIRDEVLAEKVVRAAALTARKNIPSTGFSKATFSEEPFLCVSGGSSGVKELMQKWAWSTPQKACHPWKPQA